MNNRRLMGFSLLSKKESIMVIILLLSNLMCLGNTINSVISVAATYNVCKDKFTLLVFVAVNKLFGNSILAICFMSNEKYPLYKFSMELYIDAGFKLPYIY